jgi:hypothetical protein
MPLGILVPANTDARRRNYKLYSKQKEIDMSYPSIKEIVNQRGLDLQSAHEEQLKPVLLEAFRVDLKQGMNFLEKFAAEAKATGKRLLHIESPNSPLGKQLIRLLGTDISRKLVAENLNVAFGFYNCCNVVCAAEEAALHLSLREQIELQNGAAE